MSAGVIRREDLTAFEHWEMEAFGNSRARDIELPTAEQIEQMHRNAHDEGYAAGYTEGSAAARAEAAKIAALLEGLDQELANVDHQIAEYALGFALVLAQSVLRTALHARPELMLPTVREALAELPAQGDIRRLYVHPEDARMLRQHGGELTQPGNWQIVEDVQVSRGGARVRTAQAEVDATLPTRWQRALAALGREDAWFGDETPQPEQADDSAD